LIDRTAGTDRQWKGMMAWMLGIAGARHVMKRERYRWIAPLSAFFPNNVQPVTLVSWPTALPPGKVVVDRDPFAKTRLTPDYLVLRSSAGKRRNWAVVEAKGSKRPLENRAACPKDWKKQVRNVQLTVGGIPLKIPRHLVVATRVYPNAKKPVTRRLQIRAWNNARERSPHLPDEAVVEIVTAHLFGLFKTLQMPVNAQALASAMQLRAGRVEQPGLFDSQERRADAAATELDQRAATPGNDGARHVTLRIGGAEVEVHLTSPLVQLVRALQRFRDVSSATEAIVVADRALDDWEHRTARSISLEPPVQLPNGMVIRFRRRPLE
jgi:hypothetical protein